MMDQKQILQLFNEVGAIITDTHVVFTSGNHGNAYVNKDGVYPYTRLSSLLCREIAERFASCNIDGVVGPAVGGVILSQWTAFHLSEIQGKEILGVYGEPKDELLTVGKSGNATVIVDGREIPLGDEDKLFIRHPQFVIKRGYDKLIAGKRFLVVEDILTTGGSAKGMVQAVEKLGGIVVGLGVLCNRGGITYADVGNVPVLKALIAITLDSYTEDDCPLCKTNVPINTDVGKGRDFLARQGKS